jgi:hypothetical protein
MLASTVQFSTYDQSPPADRPRRTPTRVRMERYEDPEAPEPESTDHRRGRPAPSGPNSVPTTTPPPPAPFPTPPQAGSAVLGAGDSRRPNWSAFHPRAPPQTPADHHDLAVRPGLGAALHHPGNPGGECSLERR